MLTHWTIKTTRSSQRQKNLLTPIDLQHPLMIKTLQKEGIEGAYFNIIKDIYDRPTASIISLGKADSISSKIRKNLGMLTPTTLIQQSSGSPSHGNQRRKRSERNSNWKRNKTITFTNDMMLYTENLKYAIRKLLELINELSKVAGYKINIQKSDAFLHTNN